METRGRGENVRLSTVNLKQNRKFAYFRVQSFEKLVRQKSNTERNDWFDPFVDRGRLLPGWMFRFVSFLSHTALLIDCCFARYFLLI